MRAHVLGHDPRRSRDATHSHIGMTVRRPAVSPRWIGAQIGRFGAMLTASRQTKAATQIGGSRAAVVPHEVTFRDRGGRLRAAPDGCQRAESMIVDRPGRSFSPRFGRSTPTAAPPRPRLRVGRDRSDDGARWERAWPLIMIWCPDRRAVNTVLTACFGGSVASLCVLGLSA
jgi:hypothetical protein